MSHLCVFTPRWLREWILSAALTENSSLQMSHLWLLPSLCTRQWRFRFTSDANFLSHKSHLYGFSTLWQQGAFGVSFWVETILQISHLSAFFWVRLSDSELMSFEWPISKQVVLLVPHSCLFLCCSISRHSSRSSADGSSFGSSLITVPFQDFSWWCQIRVNIHTTVYAGV